MIYEAIADGDADAAALLRHPAHPARAPLHDPRLGEHPCASPASSPPSPPRSPPTARSTPTALQANVARAARRRRARHRRHRHDGRGRQPEHAPSAAPSSPRSPRPPTGRVPVIAGVSAGTPAGRRATPRDAADAGAVALMCLPPLGYRGRRARDRRLLRARSARATGLPLMAYNNPEASGVDMPADADRADRRARSSRSSRSRSARATRAASRAARRTRPSLEVLVGGDDWALEGFAAGATGWVVGRGRRRARASASRSTSTAAPATSTRAREVYRAAAAARALRHDAQARAVLQGRDGRGRLRRRPVRAPRLPLDDAERAALRDGAAPSLRRRRSPHEGGALPGRGRLPHRGDADARHHRRRRADPGRDDARAQAALRGRAATTCGCCSCASRAGTRAMSGAILQPPTRDDADWGVLFIEVSGCLPMCGHGTIGVATVLVETGMVEVREPETVVRLDTPAGPGRGARGGRRRARRGRDAPQRARLPARARPGRRRRGPRRRAPTTWPSAATSTRSSRPPRSASRSIRRARGELIEARRRDPRRDPPTARAPGRRAHRGLPSRRLPRARARRRATRATRRRSTPAGWTARRAAPARSARMAALHARGELALGEAFVNESVIGTRFTGRLVEEIEVGGVPAVVPEITGRAWITGDGPVPARRARPLPGRLRPVRPCEVAVVGAGIVGAATACELHARGVDVAAARPRRGVGRDDRAGGGQRAVLATRTPAPSSSSRSPACAVYDELEALLGEQARIRRKGALDRPPRGARRGRARRCAVEHLRAAGAHGYLRRRRRTCARWSPSSRASWPARRSSRPTCSARRARSRARARRRPCRACTPAWRCRRSRSRATR